MLTANTQIIPVHEIPKKTFLNVPNKINETMFDTSSRSNSYIELSEIRKLDNLLTQCESTSCENICIDCCAQLGSIDNIVSTKSSSCSAVISITNSDIACNAGMKKTTIPSGGGDVDIEKVRYDNAMEKNNKSENDVRNGEDEKESKKNCCRFCDKNLRKNFANARFFSLDKERSEKLETKQIVEKGGSENTLATSRKLCTFKEFEEPVRRKSSKVDTVNVKNATQDACDKCNDQPKKLLAANVFPTTQKKFSRGKSVKEKAISLSSKSSQNSFKDGGNKSSRRDTADKEAFTFRESLRSKFSPQNLAKKITGKGLYDECEIMEKEVLFGERFDAFHHEIKIPEPVEAVRKFYCILIALYNQLWTLPVCFSHSTGQSRTACVSLNLNAISTSLLCAFLSYKPPK